MEWEQLIGFGVWSFICFVIGMWACSHFNERDNEKLWLKDADEFRRMMATCDKLRREAEEAEAELEEFFPKVIIKNPAKLGWPCHHGEDCEVCGFKAAEAAIEEDE